MRPGIYRQQYNRIYGHWSFLLRNCVFPAIEHSRLWKCQSYFICPLLSRSTSKRSGGVGRRQFRAVVRIKQRIRSFWERYEGPLRRVLTGSSAIELRRIPNMAFLSICMINDMSRSQNLVLGAIRVPTYRVQTSPLELKVETEEY